MNNNEIPRICKILDVQPMQHFKINGIQAEYWISDSGDLRCETVALSVYDLVNLINGHHKIVKIPMWTNEDIAFAKSFANFIVGGDEVVFRRFEDGTLQWSCDEEESWDRLPWRAFEALKPGHSVTLADIIANK